jgi:hypothetical protein
MFYILNHRNILLLLKEFAMKKRLLLYFSIAAFAVLALTGCENPSDPQGSTPDSTVINIAAIKGVTAPAMGGTPVKAITPTDQYTGTVTWNGSPSTFAASTMYTATITLSPKEGYILTGVAANFFTVAGAMLTSNNANSGIITAVFPATAAVNPVPVAADFDISGTGTFTYDGSPRAVTVTPKSGKSSGAITVKYNGSTTAPSAVGAYTVTFDVAAAAGFSAANGVAAGTLTINAIQTPVAADFNISGTGAFTYDGSPRAVTITPKAGKSSGAITIKYNDNTTAPSAAGSYTVTFDVEEATGFNPASGVAAGTLTINKAAGAAVSAPTLNGTPTLNSITINAIAAPGNGQTVEYAINTSNTAPTTEWQPDTTFNGLNIGTTYYIFARSASNDTYNTGTASGRLSVTTLQTVSEDRIEYYWVDQHGSLVTTSGGATYVAADATLTITAQSTGYTVKQWFLDGFNTGQSGNTYIFSSTVFGKHTVGLFVEKDGKLYNTNIDINVIFALGGTGPGGGKIFYYSEAGFTMTDNNQVCHYLEAAPDELPTELKWASSGYSSTDISGTGTAIGTGRKNTALILATDANAPAAKACTDYRGPNNLTDWFLPSKDELNQLYTNRTYVGNMGINWHWSSSQNLNYSYAWSQRFSDGSQYGNASFGDYKNYTFSVRAVRAF